MTKQKKINKFEEPKFEVVIHDANDEMLKPVSKMKEIEGLNDIDEYHQQDFKIEDKPNLVVADPHHKKSKRRHKRRQKTHEKSQLYYFIKARQRWVKPIPARYYIHLICPLILMICQLFLIDITLRLEPITYIQYTLYILYRTFVFTLYAFELLSGLHSYMNFKILVMLVMSSSFL